MNSTRFVIHTHLPAPRSVFREVSTGEAVCPHTSHWARAAGSILFSSSFEFRIFRTNKMSSPTAVQPPPPVKPPPTPPSAAASAGKGVSSKIYNGIIGYADKFVPAKLRPLWVHPAGGLLSTFMRYQFTVIVLIHKLFFQDQRRFSSGHPLSNG